MTQEPGFEGAEVGGKRFPFARITVAAQPKIIRTFRPTVIAALREKYFPQTNNLRMWKKVRAVAFVKDWKWKYLGIIPKELRSSEIGLKESGEIQASFFVYLQGMVNGHDAPLLSAIDSKTVNEPTKSEP
jgi:hypothetical protein